ncbi:MAG TPA: hypothetical protein VGM53_16920 [Streptosporangiaceae bacterium]|jgi:uncharacterized membrane-anchored protein
MTYPQQRTHAYQPEGSIRRLFPEPVAVKVPEITALFWVVKIMTTAGGEATSDWLSLGNRIVGGGIEAGIFIIALIWQFRTRRYVAAAYWLLAYSIAIFGTGIADAMHLFIGIPYAGTSLLWAVVLALIFWLWHRNEGTLSIHSIITTRREIYYWATVFATFALGTAVGDYTATALHLGYLASGVAFGIAILIPLMLWSGLNLNSVFCFWFAYVLTRPLGASFADYFSKSHHLSGAGYGDGPTAAIATIVVAVLVAYLAISRSDIQRPEELVPGGGPDAGRPRDHRRVSY